MKVALSAGRTSDHTGYDALTDSDLPAPKVLIADKVCDANAIRGQIAAQGGTPVIPARRARSAPEPISAMVYALRNRIERRINRLKNARHLATRYDKTATSYLGFIEIISARLWFRHLST